MSHRKKDMEWLREQVDKLNIRDDHGKQIKADQELFSMTLQPLEGNDCTEAIVITASLEEITITQGDNVISAPAYTACEMFKGIDQAHGAWHNQVSGVIERVAGGREFGKVLGQIGHAHMMSGPEPGEA